MAARGTPLPPARQRRQRQPSIYYSERVNKTWSSRTGGRTVGPKDGGREGGCSSNSSGGVCSARFMAHFKPIQSSIFVRLWVIRLAQIMPVIVVGPIRWVIPPFHLGETQHCPNSTFPVTHPPYLLPRHVPALPPSLHAHVFPSIRPSVGLSDCAKKERSAVCICPTVVNSPTLSSVSSSPFAMAVKRGGYCDFIPHKRALYDSPIVSPSFCTSLPVLQILSRSSLLAGARIALRRPRSTSSNRRRKGRPSSSTRAPSVERGHLWGSRRRRLLRVLKVTMIIFWEPMNARSESHLSI